MKRNPRESKHLVALTLVPTISEPLNSGVGRPDDDAGRPLHGSEGVRDAGVRREPPPLLQRLGHGDPAHVLRGHERLVKAQYLRW